MSWLPNVLPTAAGGWTVTNGTMNAGTLTLNAGGSATCTLTPSTLANITDSFNLHIGHNGAANWKSSTSRARLKIVYASGEYLNAIIPLNKLGSTVDNLIYVDSQVYTSLVFSIFNGEAGTVVFTPVELWPQAFTATEDSKSFFAQPVAPYNVGDLWFMDTSGNGFVRRCINPKLAGQAYDINDWPVVKVQADFVTANVSLTTPTIYVKGTDAGNYMQIDSTNGLTCMSNGVVMAKIDQTGILGPTISGGVVSGALIRTADAGQRIELGYSPGTDSDQVAHKSGSTNIVMNVLNHHSQTFFVAAGTLITGVLLKGFSDQAGMLNIIIEAPGGAILTYGAANYMSGGIPIVSPGEFTAPVTPYLVPADATLTLYVECVYRPVTIVKSTNSSYAGGTLDASGTDDLYFSIVGRVAESWMQFLDSAGVSVGHLTADNSGNVDLEADGYFSVTADKGLDLINNTGDINIDSASQVLVTGDTGVTVKANTAKLILPSAANANPTLTDGITVFKNIIRADTQLATANTSANLGTGWTSPQPAGITYLALGTVYTGDIVNLVGMIRGNETGQTFFAAITIWDGNTATGTQVVSFSNVKPYATRDTAMLSGVWKVPVGYNGSSTLRVYLRINFSGGTTGMVEGASGVEVYTYMAMQLMR